MKTTPSAVPVFTANCSEGLSTEQVRQREQAGLCNIAPPSNTKSEKQIVKENCETPLGGSNPNDDLMERLLG